ALIGQGLSQAAMPLLTLSLLWTPLKIIGRGLLTIAGYAIALTSVFGTLGARGVVSLMRIVAVGAALLGRLSSIGLIATGVYEIYQHWSQLKAIAKDPIALNIIFPQMPDWLKAWVTKGSALFKGEDASQKASRDAIGGMWKRNMPTWLGGSDPSRRQGTLNRANPAIDFSGAPASAMRANNVTNNVNASKIVNMGAPRITINMMSNASPGAVGAAAGSYIGREVRGALHDGGNP
ncbi:MAG: hypothetical protein ACRD9W_19100, partial [Terriglobia bacterium]